MYLWGFALALYLVGAGGHFYASDDQQKFEALRTLMTEGSWTWPGGWGTGQAGQPVSWFSLGASLVMLPGFLLGAVLSGASPQFSADDWQRGVIAFQNCVISASLLAISYLGARRLNFAPRTALTGAIVLGFCTIIWPYAKTSWSEPAATLALFAGALSLCEHVGHARASTLRGAWLAGALMAIACLIRTEYLIAVTGMLIAAFSIARHRPNVSVKTWQAIGWPLLAALAIHAGYEWVRHGSPLAFPNYWMPQAALTQPRAWRACENLYLALLSPNQGFFWYSPPLLLALCGWPRFRQRLPDVAWIWWGGLFPLALFYLVGWGTSTWAWGLRYGYVFVPFLLMPVLSWYETGRNRLAKALLVAGCGVQVLAWPFDFGYLYLDALNLQKFETIEQVRTVPSHAPLRLAWDRWPSSLKEAREAFAAPPSDAPAIQAMREARVHFVPDTWWMLLRRTSFPRAPLDGVPLALLAVAVYCGWRAARLTQPSDAWRSPPGSSQAGSPPQSGCR